MVETAPTRPSTAAEAAEPKRRLRGDLDTVVLKALAKDPERRYPGAETLGDDLRRYLDGFPVEARPDSVGYRARRFVRRHRTAVASAVAVAVALVAGLGTALWQGAQAQAERRTTERVNAFVTEMLASADPFGGVGRNVTVLEVADQAARRVGRDLAGEPETEAGVRLALGDTYQGTGAYAKAEAQFRRALALRRAVYGPGHARTGEALNRLGNLLVEQSRFGEADSVLALALAVHRRHPGDGRTAYASTLVLLGQAALQTGHLDGAEARLREAIGILGRLPPPVPPGLTRTLTNGRFTLGLALHEAGDYATSDSVLVPLLAEMRRAERSPSAMGSVLTTQAWNNDYLGRADQVGPLLRESLAFREDRFGPDHTETGYALNDLAYFLQYYDGDAEGAADAYRRALAIFRRAHGDDYTAVPVVLNNLASIYRGTGRVRQALPLLEEAIEIQRELLGPDHVDVTSPLINLGRVYVSLGQPDRAEEPLREALALRRRAYGDDHSRVGTALDALGAAALARGDVADAVDLYRQSVATHARALGPDHVNAAEIEAALAGVLLDRGAPGDRERGPSARGPRPAHLARDLPRRQRPDGDRRRARGAPGPDRPALTPPASAPRRRGWGRPGWGLRRSPGPSPRSHDDARTHRGPGGVPRALPSASMPVSSLALALVPGGTAAAGSGSLTLLIVFVVLAIGVSFLCSVMEAVLLSVTPAYIGVKEETAPATADRLKALKADIDKPLAAILTLNTIAHTVGATGAGAQAAAIWAGQDVWIVSAVTVFSAVLTLGILILSEIIPKTSAPSTGAGWRRSWPGRCGPIIAALQLTGLIWLSQVIATRALARREGGGREPRGAGRPRPDRRPGGRLRRVREPDPAEPVPVPQPQGPRRDDAPDGRGGLPGGDADRRDRPRRDAVLAPAGLPRRPRPRHGLRPARRRALGRGPRRRRRPGVERRP